MVDVARRAWCAAASSGERSERLRPLVRSIVERYGLPEAARALPLSLPDTDSLFLQFAATFINRISAAGAAGAPALYDHLAGFTDDGDGAALLVALELITRHHTKPPYLAGLATALASSVCALLAVASDVIFAGNWPRGGGGAIAQTLQAGGRAVALAPLETCCAPLQACPAWALDALLGADRSHTMSLTEDGGSSMTASMQGEARALFGHTCVRLVALLEHVLRSTQAVSEMLNGGRVAALLEALAYDLRATDAGVFLVQRHMVRALASLLATASRSSAMLLVLRDRKVMRLLLALLGPASAAPFLPPVLRVELCQLLVFTLMRSAGVSSVLVSDFETDGQGYAVLLANLLAVARTGASHEKLALVAALCHLLSLPSNTSSYATLSHSSSFSFVSFNSSPSSLHSSTASIIQSSISLPSSTSSSSSPASGSAPSSASSGPYASSVAVHNVEAARVLLQGYTDCKSMELRAAILRTCTSLFSRVSIEPYVRLQHLRPLSVLLGEFDALEPMLRNAALSLVAEVATRTPLPDDEVRAYAALLKSTRMSSVLLAAKHITRAVEERTMGCGALSRADLVVLLIETLATPPALRPVPVSLSEPDELRLCLALLSPQEAAAAGVGMSLSSSDSITSLSIGANGERIAVVYAVALRLLNLLLVFLTVSNEPLRDPTALRRLEALLPDSRLRQAALKVIAVVAATEVSMAVRVVPDLVNALGSSGGATSLDRETLVMRRDILATLTHVFGNSAPAQIAFRSAGGFVWAASVLDGVARALQETNATSSSFTLSSLSSSPNNTASNSVAEAVSFVLGVVRTLAGALKGCAENGSYFATDLHGFTTLYDALSRTPLFAPPSAASASAALLTMAVRGTWPPSCARHERADLTCAACKDASLLEHSAAAVLLVRLLVSAEPNITLAALEPLLVLAENSVNAARLAGAGLVRALLNGFEEAFLSANHVLHTLILRLVERVAAQHVALDELRGLLALLRRANVPPSLLASLVRAVRSGPAPPHYADLAHGSCVASPVLAERPWPPAAGYTLSLWLCVPTFRDTSCVLVRFAATGNSHIALELERGTLALCAAPRERLQFTEAQAQLSEGEWRHVVVTHAPGSSGTAQARLYIDGLRASQGPLTYPRPLPATLSLTLGSTEEATTGAWYCGNMLVLESALKDAELFLLYQLGPAHTGPLTVDLSAHAVREVVTPRTVTRFAKKPQVLTTPAMFSLSHLQERLLAAFSPRTLLFAHPPAPPAAAGRALVASHGRVHGVEHIAQARFREQAANVGGLSSFLYLIAAQRDADTRRDGVRLVHGLCAWNARALHDLESGGVAVLARLMRRQSWLLDEALLSALFELAGLGRSPRTGLYSSGVLTSLPVLRTLLLDWRLWRGATLRVQALLLGSLAELLVGHEHHLFHAERCRSAGLQSLILGLCREHGASLHADLHPPLLALLAASMHEPPTEEEIRLLVGFVLSAPDDMPLRSALLSLLASMCASRHEVTPRVADCCAPDVLLALLRSAAHDTRWAALRLLDLYLLHPGVAPRVERDEGLFALVARLLAPQPPSDALFALLFCMLLGRAPVAQRLRELKAPVQDVRAALVGRLPEEVQLARPDALLAIASLAAQAVTLGGREAEAALGTLKAIEDLWVQNERVREQMLSAGLADLLAEMLLALPAAAVPPPSFEGTLHALVRALGLHAISGQRPGRALADLLAALAAHNHPAAPSLTVSVLAAVYRVLVDSLRGSANIISSPGPSPSSKLQAGAEAVALASLPALMGAHDSGADCSVAIAPVLQVAIKADSDAPRSAAPRELLLTLASFLLALRPPTAEVQFLRHGVTALEACATHSSSSSYSSEGSWPARLLSAAAPLLGHSDPAFVASLVAAAAPLLGHVQPTLRVLYSNPHSASAATSSDTSARVTTAQFENDVAARESALAARAARARVAQQAVVNALLTAQHTEQGRLLSALRDAFERERAVSSEWRAICKSVTHERALWGRPALRWKLDATEGPHRSRLRYLTHFPSSLTAPPTLNVSVTLPPLPTTPPPPPPPTTPAALLSSSSSSSLLGSSISVSSLELSMLVTGSNSFLTADALLLSMKGGEEGRGADQHGGAHAEERAAEGLLLRMGERVHAAYRCCWITPFSKRAGEFLVADANAHFVCDSSAQGARHITWPYEEIKEVHKRRHLLKNNALEIFLLNGKTSLLAFDTERERNQACDQVLAMELPNRVNYEDETAGTFMRASITQKWQRGMVSNFEYLMHLNTLAGRSFNDLTQYPIFPWVLQDYSSAQLDLTSPAVFRDLSKPMGAQGKERLDKFVERFEQLVEMAETPYHYGSHYSNSGAVLHFLVRLEPFTRYFLEFQGGRFDVPDRAFHELASTWSLSSAISSSDVKELIPEFYSLAEFLMNAVPFDLGVKQDGTRVHHVVLPRWALGSPRLFVRLHREALESRHVSEHLHLWIDLIFGSKQQGEAAHRAHNMFHPLTYEGAVNVEDIKDDLMREATIAQISSYGQTPRQLFKKAHPARTSHAPPPPFFSTPDRVTGSPLYSFGSEVGYLDLHGDVPAVLGAGKALLQPDAAKYISWGHWDQSLRVCSVDTGRVLHVIDLAHDDDVLCAHLSRDGRLLATGGSASVVKVWAVLRARKSKQVTVKLLAWLHGHSASVSCVVVSHEWSVLVSGSQDGTAIVWDANRLSFVRSLLGHKGAVSVVAISASAGDVLTVDQSSTLRLWTINGELCAKNTHTDTITCVVFSACALGTYPNVVLTGASSGAIYMWDAWDLSLLRTMDLHKASVTAMCVSSDQSSMVSADKSGALISWTRK